MGPRILFSRQDGCVCGNGSLPGKGANHMPLGARILHVMFAIINVIFFTQRSHSAATIACKSIFQQVCVPVFVPYSR